MTNTVLAAIDLTHPEDQKGVLEKARQLAEIEGAPLAVVTVLPDYRMSIVGSYFPEDHTHQMVEETQGRLHEFIQETIGHDDEVKHVVRMGTAYEEILETAKELDAGLIVVGAHKPDMMDYLIGPNANRVARHAKCSVHIVRRSA